MYVQVCMYRFELCAVNLNVFVCPEDDSVITDDR